MTAQLSMDGGPAHSTATLSPCGRYRYTLGRRWGGPGGQLALWIMLNPSTADASADDPTIRRCIDFSKREGMTGLVVVNLWALRSHNPDKLLTFFEDTEGPDNEGHVRAWLDDDDVGVAIAAWGGHRAVKLRKYKAREIVEWAGEAGRTLHCLGRTKGGYPRHPLYLPKTAPLEVFG